MKELWKNKAGRIWVIVTAAVLVLGILINILASTQFFDMVCVFLGEPQVKLLGEEKSDYIKEFTTKEESLANGNKVSKEICEEGFVLLKNKDGALPLKPAETRISVFGKNSVDMAIGGSGSGGSVGKEAVSIFDSLTASGFTFNQTLVDFYKDKDASGAGRERNTSDLNTGSALALTEDFVGETSIDKYTEAVWGSCQEFKDAALIVITRIGGEGFDLPRSATDHILKLRPAEKALIEKVKTLDFGKVILVLNTPATLELKEINADDGVDAILWTGFAGGNGMSAFGEILKGKTLTGVEFSPSGKTVDTWAANFMRNPAWENFGAALGGDAYTRGTGAVAQKAYFVDYEEGVYVGYRFYETAHAQSNKNMGAGAGAYTFNYDDEVVYPFGYGLSYTKFAWEIQNKSEIAGKALTANTSLTFRVKVTNTGEYPGRDVVQLYVAPPYKGAGGIEKPAKVLVGFAKTKLLLKDASETLEITVSSPYEFASYDYKDANANGFKGYEAESGNYSFYISNNAHNKDDKAHDGAPLDPITCTVAAPGIKYEKDPATGTTVVNQYTDQEKGFNSDEELGSILSRANWTGTWPARRTAAEKKIDDRLEWLSALTNPKSNPNRPAQNDAMPATGKSHGVKFSELKGLDYKNQLWEKFLDQLTVKEMNALVNKGAFKTMPVSRLGVPQTIAADGPVGWCNFLGGTSIYDTCVYPCQVVISSTWNIERLYDMGKAIGNEGLVGDINNGGTPYTGWYAPGLNIHRTPFGGRNFEYYSEDALLSGKLTAAIVKGAASKGVYTDMKHFALNDQETHRGGVLTWATEQSMREIYLKAFEIAVKTAKAGADGVKVMGMMSSFNRIGERWIGGDYRLLTTILRGEWGFEGLVICDFNTISHLIVKDMVYAGGDINLEMTGVRVYKPKSGSAADVTVFRQACKNILYTIVNSNAMRGEFKMTMPTWQILMFITDAVLAAGFAVWGFFVIRKIFSRHRTKIEVQS